MVAIHGASELSPPTKLGSSSSAESSAGVRGTEPWEAAHEVRVGRHKPSEHSSVPTHRS